MTSKKVDTKVFKIKSSGCFNEITNNISYVYNQWKD